MVPFVCCLVYIGWLRQPSPAGRLLTSAKSVFWFQSQFFCSKVSFFSAFWTVSRLVRKLLTTLSWLSFSLRSLERPVKHKLGKGLKMELLRELRR